MRLCANMFLKGLFTSDIDYQPGISASEARKLGLLDQGVSPIPREMAFPLPKGADWHQLYDYIKFPPDTKVAQFGIIANAKSVLRQPKVDPVHVHSQEEHSLYQDKMTKLDHVNHVNVRAHVKPHQETLGNIHLRDESKVMQMNLLLSLALFMAIFLEQQLLHFLASGARYFQKGLTCSHKVLCFLTVEESKLCVLKK